MSGYCMSNRPAYRPSYDYTGLFDQKWIVDVTVDGTAFKIIIQSKEKASTKGYVDVLQRAANHMERVGKTNANNMINSDDYRSDKEGEVAVLVGETIFKIIIQCSYKKLLSTKEYITVLRKAAEEIDRTTQEPTGEGR